MMDYPRYSISEMHLGHVPDSLEFRSWKVSFKTKVCAKSAFLHIAMHWIKEVEMAKSTDGLMTSQSITGRRDFVDYEMLDAMIASALQKLVTHVHFRKRVIIPQQHAQKDDRFSRGRHIACMIHEHFRATGVQGLSDLFNVRVQDDDVQVFDTRWDQALLAASEILTESVLEGLYRSKLQDSVHFHIVLALKEQENIRNNEPPSCSRLKTTVRLHIDQTMRTRNLRARNEIVERGTVTKRQKKREKSQRGEESGTMLPVERNWTVFARRLMQFQS